MILTNYTNKIKSNYKVLGIVGAATTLAIPYLIMLLNNHNHHLENKQSLCPFKMLTGFPCPGCGITKSLICIYEGDLTKSIYYHLFGPFVFVLCVIVVIVLMIELINKKKYFRSIFYNKRLAYLLGTSLAIYHLVRIVYFISNNSFSDIIKQSIWG